VLKVDKDGSATIAWKKLADFPRPFFLFMSDEDLMKRINTIIARENLFGIEITIKDNWLFLRGAVAKLNRLHSVLKNNGIRYRGETVSIRPAGFQ
jgi:hypothetical protein